jgi:hypothetical protein
VLDRRNPAQITYEAFEGSNVTRLSLCKTNWFPKFLLATPTFLLMTMQHDELTFPAYRKPSKCALETTLQGQLVSTSATSSTSTLVISQLNVVISRASAVLRSKMLVATNPKHVIHKTRRRHCGSPLLCIAIKEDDPLGDDFSTHLFSLTEYTHPGICAMNPNS